MMDQKARLTEEVSNLEREISLKDGPVMLVSFSVTKINTRWQAHPVILEIGNLATGYELFRAKRMSLSRNFIDRVEIFYDRKDGHTTYRPAKKDADPAEHNIKVVSEVLDIIEDDLSRFSLDEL